ncbi:MAG: holo-ACP synthase [Nitrospinae bacterium]|nr:holo-ACP synthase [Nitrospinota bacterium]
MSHTSPPFVLRSGVDLVVIDRIERSLARYGDAFVAKVFTRAEAAHCTRRPRPAPSYAARFAAKEAVMKVLGKGVFTIPFTAIEIGADADGRPTVTLHGKAKERADEIGLVSLDLSMSHDGGMAMAFAVGYMRG